MIVHNQQENHAICGQLGTGTVDKCPKRTMPVLHPKVEGGVGPARKGHRNGVNVNNFLFFLLRSPYARKQRIDSRRL